MSSRSSKQKKLERTAYHEAGHVVAAYFVRRGFSYISIEPGEDSLGHVVYQKFRDSFRPDYDKKIKTRLPLEKVIIIGLAGYVAEKIFTGRRGLTEAVDDFQIAFDYASILTGGAEETSAFVKWLLIRTENMLRTPQNWAAVQALAEELLKVKKIKYHRARKIIREAQRKKEGTYGKSDKRRRKKRSLLPD